jgi:hypothetical protein
MVTLTRLIVTLYVHCPSYLSVSSLVVPFFVILWRTEIRPAFIWQYAKIKVIYDMVVMLRVSSFCVFTIWWWCYVSRVSAYLRYGGDVTCLEFLRIFKSMTICTTYILFLLSALTFLPHVSISSTHSFYSHSTSISHYNYPFHCVSFSILRMAAFFTRCVKLLSVSMPS